MTVMAEEAANVPSYDDLPRLRELDLPHAWDVLNHDLGSVSFIDEACRREAVRTVRLGETLGLNLSLDLIDPPLFGRALVAHRIVEVGSNTLEDVLDDFNPQASSQWDGLKHVRAREHGFFGGLTDLVADPLARGIQHWAERGIVGRGVLLDIPRWAAATGRNWDALAGSEITAQDLHSCAQHQGVEIIRGDVVCVRTGWVSAYRALEPGARADPALGTRFSGLRADEDMARFVWDSRLGAIGADNPALEGAPGDRAAGSLHRRLIPLLGTAVAELLDLDALAERCSAIGRWTFLFVAVPLPLPGGVSSPANALAVL
jgi:kynurenine formamidase